jgi:hypothetical protein
LVLVLVWMRMSSECIFPPLNVDALRTFPEAHVAMGSGVLHVVMGIGAAVGTAGTALAPQALDVSPRPGGCLPADVFMDLTVVSGDDHPGTLNGASEAGESGRVT